MAKKISGAKTSKVPRPQEREKAAPPVAGRAARPSSLLDTRLVYCGDNLEQLARVNLLTSNLYLDKLNPTVGVVLGSVVGYFFGKNK